MEDSPWSASTTDPTRGRWLAGAGCLAVPSCTQRGVGVEFACEHLLPGLVTEALRLVFSWAAGVADRTAPRSGFVAPARSHIIVVSALPGRVRLHVPELRGDLAYAGVIALVLQHIPSVRLAETNARSGNILIYFDPRQVSANEIQVALEPRRRSAPRRHQCVHITRGRGRLALPPAKARSAGQA